MILGALLITTTADTERQTADPLQGSNGTLGVVGNPHPLTTEAALGTESSQELFRRSFRATSIPCHGYGIPFYKAKHQAESAPRSGSSAPQYSRRDERDALWPPFAEPSSRKDGSSQLTSICLPQRGSGSNERKSGPPAPVDEDLLPKLLLRRVSCRGKSRKRLELPIAE